MRRRLVYAAVAGGVATAAAVPVRTADAQPREQRAPEPGAPARAAMPHLHHVGLNSVDPERAIAWYLRAWPAARRTEVAGQPGVAADMLLLFARVDRPPAGAWRDDLHRSEPQSAFWHIGATNNTTDLDARLGELGVAPLPLYTSPADTQGVCRSGLPPYAGVVTAAQLATADTVPPRPGGFSYVVAPDGVLFEFTGGPRTREALSHIHFFHERPLCAANWYVKHLDMALPPLRDSIGAESPRPPWLPCDVPYGEPGWPSLEPIGTIRQPAGGVRFGNGAMQWYPRPCVGGRCGTDQPLASSHGQALDHVGFTAADFDALLAQLCTAGVTVLEEPYTFGNARAVTIKDPDGLAIELMERRGDRPPNRWPDRDCRDTPCRWARHAVARLRRQSFDDGPMPIARPP